MITVSKYALLIVVVAFGLGSITPSYGQGVSRPTKSTECQAISDLFESASTNFQNAGNLNSSLSLVERLTTGLQKLQLQDPKLKNLQSRYLQYFSSSSQLMNKAGQNTGNNSALESMMNLAQANSSIGSQLSLELVEYCLQ